MEAASSLVSKFGPCLAPQWFTWGPVGTEEVCSVTLAEGLTIPQQSIGVATVDWGFSGFDGILGYAYYYAEMPMLIFPAQHWACGPYSG